MMTIYLVTAGVILVVLVALILLIQGLPEAFGECVDVGGGAVILALLWPAWAILACVWAMVCFPGAVVWLIVRIVQAFQCKTDGDAVPGMNPKSPRPARGGR